MYEKESEEVYVERDEERWTGDNYDEKEMIQEEEQREKGGEGGRGGGEGGG